MEGKKTLGDYISAGNHESIAFVKNSESYDVGNKLGNLFFGVLVCDRGNSKGNDRAKLFHKTTPLIIRDSDIAFMDFSYGAEVFSEIPLGISATIFQEWILQKHTEEFQKARELLKKYGIYWGYLIRKLLNLNI